MRMLIILGLLALGTSLPYQNEGSDWKAVVLKAKSVTHLENGKMEILLANGETVQVAKDNWSEAWSGAVDRSIKAQEAEMLARSSAEPPTDQEASAMIREHCAKEWPDDFQMRKFCEDQQYEGLRALRARSMIGTPLASIRTKCAIEWPDDYQMRDFCEKQQLKALEELRRR
jgi:hypothetical protein